MSSVYRIDWRGTANGWAALVWVPGRPDLSRRFAPPTPWQKGKDARPVRVRADEYAAQLERDGYTYQPDSIEAACLEIKALGGDTAVLFETAPLFQSTLPVGGTTRKNK